MAGIHLLLLLFSLFAFSSSAKVFLSIDCGASGTYTDENMIKWVPDYDYVKGGESQVVPSTNSGYQVLESLRVFKTGTKNCYSIKVDKGERVLVRASFYYGNYDNKFVPPKFDLELNGIYWATVEVDLSNDIYSFYEAIYNVEGGGISVCLAQTSKGQFPFISALEVRSLDASMYSQLDSSRALFIAMRVYGSETNYVRYPDDIYDRLWQPTALTPTISEDSLNITVKVGDNPPEVVMQNAVTSEDINSTISFSVIYLPEDAVPVYVNMYFAELVELDSSNKRSFHAYIDNKRLSSTPIIPSYGNVGELTFTNITASNTTVFSLKATSDSTMPPIINAFEIFTYSDVFDKKDNSGNGNGNGNGKNKSKNYSGNDNSGTAGGYGSDSHIYMFITACIYVLYQLF